MPPSESFQAATEASAEVVVEPAVAAAAASDRTVADIFDGIDWAQLSGFQEPAAPHLRKKSWIFRYGYRVVLKSESQRTFFICKYCHQRRVIDTGGPGQYEVTGASTSAIVHLSTSTPGHGHTETEKSALPAAGSGLVADLVKRGSAPCKQQIDIYGFRTAVLRFLTEGNFPLSEVESPSFRRMLHAANREAERALRKICESISRFVLKLFTYMKPLLRRHSRSTLCLRIFTH